MVLFPTGIARMAIYYVHSKYDFWHDFAGKGMLNVLKERKGSVFI